MRHGRSAAKVVSVMNAADKLSSRRHPRAKQRPCMRKSSLAPGSAL